MSSLKSNLVFYFLVLGVVAGGLLSAVGARTGVILASNNMVSPDGQWLSYVPIVHKPQDMGIYGFVRFQGNPAAGVYLRVRAYRNGAWMTQTDGFTDAAGRYSFKGLPSVTGDERYYVRYNSDSDSSKLWLWATGLLGNYPAGAQVHLGDFDIANVEYREPSSGAQVSLPRYFRWNSRNYSPTDNYEFNLYDYDTGDPWFWTNPPLGFTDSYLLTSLPSGFSPNTWYVWNMWIYPTTVNPSTASGYGIAYWARYVSFYNFGSPSRMRQAPAGQLLSEERLEQLMLEAERAGRLQH